MKIFLDHTNLRVAERLDGLARASLASLEQLASIGEARIRIEHRPEASPAYRATALLMVPGPDLRVDVVDHTVRTALAKLFSHLRARMVERATHRMRRNRAGARLNHQGPGRRSSGGVGCLS
jgi:uncharacterized protein (DUF2384 family)